MSLSMTMLSVWADTTKHQCYWFWEIVELPKDKSLFFHHSHWPSLLSCSCSMGRPGVSILKQRFQHLRLPNTFHARNPPWIIQPSLSPAFVLGPGVPAWPPVQKQSCVSPHCCRAACLLWVEEQQGDTSLPLLLHWKDGPCSAMVGGSNGE